MPFQPLNNTSSVAPEAPEEGVYNFDSAKQDKELITAIKRYARNVDNQVFKNDDEALEWWKGDRRWKDANTVSILKELNTVSKASGHGGWGAKRSEQDLKDLAVIRDRWEKIPGVFSPDRGTGLGERAAALTENIAKGTIDPSLIVGGVGGKAAASAVNVGLKAAGKELLSAGAKAGVKAGVGIAADAGIAAGANVAYQKTGVELGLQDEVDPWSAIVAGGVGAGLSAPGNVVNAKSAAPKKGDINAAKEQAIAGSQELKRKGITELFTPKERTKFTEGDFTPEGNVAPSVEDNIDVPFPTGEVAKNTANVPLKDVKGQETLASQLSTPAPKMQQTEKKVLDYITGNMLGINSIEGEDKFIGGVDFILKEAGVGKTSIKKIEDAAKQSKGTLNEKGQAILDLPQGTAGSSTDLATINFTRNALQKIIMDEATDPDVAFRALEMSNNLVAKRAALLGESARGMAYARWREYTPLSAGGFLDKTAKIVGKVAGNETDRFATKAGRAEYIGDVRQAMRELLEPDEFGQVDPLKVDLFHANLMNQGVSKGDMFWEAWYNSLLSSPSTQVINVSGNALTTSMQAMEYAFSHSTSGVNPGHIFSAYAKAIPEAWQVFKRTFTTEVPNDPLTRLEVKEAQAIPSVVLGEDRSALNRWSETEAKLSKDMSEGYPASNLGEAPAVTKKLRKAGVGEKGIGGRQIRLPGRFLMAMDDAFKVIHYRAGITDAAIRELKAQEAAGVSMTKAQFLEALNAKVSNPTPEMHKYGTDISRTLTFTQPLGQIGQGLQRIINEIPLGRLMVPFVRTPGNLLKQAGDMTLPWTERTAGDFAAGGMRAKQATARLTMGWGITAMGAWGAMNGLVNGGGPSDPAEKQAWLTDNLPWSVKLGNTWVQWNRLDPVAMPFAIGAGATDMAKAMNDPNREDALWITTAKLFSDAILDKTWFQGVQNVMNALTDPEKSGDTFLNGVTRTFVPSIVAATGRAYDPRVLAPQTFMEVIQDRLAFENRSKVVGKLDVLGREIDNYSLNAKQDVLGRDVPVSVLGATEKGGVAPSGVVSGLIRMFSPVKTKEADTDRVAAEISNLKIKIKPPSEKWNGVKLTSEQLYVYSKARGQYIYNGISHLQENPGWENMNVGVKRLIIDKLKTEATKFADVALYGVYPDIIKQRYEPTRMDKTKGFFEPTRKQELEDVNPFKKK